MQRIGRINVSLPRELIAGHWCPIFHRKESAVPSRFRLVRGTIVMKHFFCSCGLDREIGGRWIRALRMSAEKIPRLMAEATFSHLTFSQKSPRVIAGCCLNEYLTIRHSPVNGVAIYTSIIAGASRISLSACRYCAPTAPSMVR